jgi:hypothetical protein
MRQRAVTTCLVGIVGFMATIAAPAQGIAQESRATAVLNVEAEGADKQLTATLTSILRNEAQQLQGYRVVNKAAINLSEIIVVLGCEASSAQCLTQAAQQLNATTLIYGNLTRDGADWRLKVEIFDAEQQRITYRLQSTIAGKDDLVVAYRSEIERFMRSVREQKDAPKLVINSNVRGAKVKINGEPVGTTPFEREGLKVGMVDLEVSSEGFTTWSVSIELAPGAEVKLNAPLKPLPKDSAVTVKDPDGGAVNGKVIAPKKGDATARHNKPSDQMSDPNWGAWALVGVGSAALIGSGVSALLMFGVEDDINTQSKAGTLDRTQYDALNERGQSYELTHRILLGVGIAAVSAGGIWLLVDKLSEPDASAQRATPRWDVRVGTHSVEALWRF